MVHDFIINGIVTYVEQKSLDGKVETKIRLIPEKNWKVGCIVYPDAVALRAGDYISAFGREDNEENSSRIYVNKIFRLKSKRNNRILESYEIKSF